MFTNLGDFVTGIQRSLAGSARVFELLSWPKETMQAKQLPANQASAPSGSMIELRNLRFNYASPEETVQADEAEYLLDEINVSVVKGKLRLWSVRAAVGRVPSSRY